MAPRYSQKKQHFQYGVHPPSWICKISIFFSNIHPRNWNLHQHTKFDRNRKIHCWDIEIKLFSKWRPFAISNLRKSPFWPCHLYLNVILHLHSKFRINRPIWRRDIAKKTQSINQSINIYWHHNSILKASMHKNIMWYQIGWLKKGTIPVKCSQPVHRKYVYKINQHTMIVIDRLLLNKELIKQNEKNKQVIHTHLIGRI